MKYLVVIEETPSGYSAYSPDLDGCVATGPTMDEAARHLQETMKDHIDEMKRSNAGIPYPHSVSQYVKVSV